MVKPRVLALAAAASVAAGLAGGRGVLLALPLMSGLVGMRSMGQQDGVRSAILANFGVGSRTRDGLF